MATRKTRAETILKLQKQLDRHLSAQAVQELSHLPGGQKLLRAVRALRGVIDYEGVDPKVSASAETTLKVMAGHLAKTFGIMEDYFLSEPAQQDEPELPFGNEGESGAA